MDTKKKYILIYEGGSMPKSEEEGKMVLEEWNKWFSMLGSDLVDGGFPFMAGAMMTDGKMEAASGVPLSGYSIIMAMNYKEAMDKAMKCPVTMGGSKIHLFEEMPMAGM